MPRGDQQQRRPGPRWPDRIACPTCGKDATRVDGYEDDPQYWCVTCQYSQVTFRQAVGQKVEPVRSEVPRTAAGGECRCGCGGKTGALYVPGHDSRHLSQVLARLRADELTFEQALQEVPFGLHGELVHRLRRRPVNQHRNHIQQPTQETDHE